MLKWRGREQFKCRMQNAKCKTAPGPFTFRGCDLTARIPPCHGGSPGATPGSRTSLRPLHVIGQRLPRRCFSEGGLHSRPERATSRQANFKTSRAPACAAEFPKLSLPGEAPGRLASLLTTWGRGRKVMHLPCKQAQAGALPAVLHHFIAGRMRFRRAS